METMIRTDQLLTTAAFRGELERVRQMLDHGAATSSHCERLCTALHWASSMGHLEVCSLLVERGADVNARSVNGESPLHVAAREGDAETAQFLLDAGANPRLCNSAGRTALDLAVEFAEDEVELIHALRQAQAQHDARALKAADTAKAARPKVQIVWESELQAGTAASGASRTVESGCGPDEPLDVSDGTSAAAPKDDAAAIAARLAKWGITSPAETAAPTASSSSAAPSQAEEKRAGASAPVASIDAGALSALASSLFAWDAIARDDVLPG